MKRVLSVVLGSLISISLILSACSGNGSDNTNSAKETDAQSSPATSSAETKSKPTEGSKHFSLYYPGMTTPINLDGPGTKEIMQKSGIVWDKVEVGNGSDVAQQVNLKLASGSLADAITLSASSEIWARLIKAEKLIPLDKYFEDPVNYPNLAKIDKRIIDFWRVSDGHIYFVPTGYEAIMEEPSAWNGKADGLWIRQDLLQTAGMTNDEIKTLEGLETFLGKIKGMTDDKGRKIIPLSIGGQNFPYASMITAMFGTAKWNEQSDGTLLPDYRMPGFKQAWQWLNKMYKEGILDAETTYHKDDLYNEKLNSLRYGALFTGGWGAPNPFVLQENKLPTTTTYADLEKNGFPAEWYSMTELPQVPEIKPTPYLYLSPFGGNGTGVTIESDNPDLLLKALDWMQTEEAYRIMEWGPESLGAHSVKDGAAVQHDDVFMSDKFWGGTNPMKNVTDIGFWWWKNIASVSSTHILVLEPPFPVQNAEMYKAEQLNWEQGFITPNPVWNNLIPIIGGNIEKYTPIQNDIRLKYFAKMMMAKSDNDFNAAYDHFLDEMKVRGHDNETIEEFNKQYKDYANTPAGKIEWKISKTIPRNVYGKEPVVVGK